jgi:hypothetical protein
MPIAPLVSTARGGLAGNDERRAPVPEAVLVDAQTNSYFVATVGGATLEVVNRYVEDQRNK